MHFAFGKVGLGEIGVVNFAAVENGFIQLLPFENGVIENAVLENCRESEVFALRKIDAREFAIDKFDIGNFTILDRCIAQVAFLEYAVDEVDTGQVRNVALHKPDLLVATFQQWLNVKIFVFNSVETAGTAH